ncbi:MAG: hypothetical protein ACREXR_00180 [Gammaproteobacteria bacterium]
MYGRERKVRIYIDPLNLFSAVALAIVVGLLAVDGIRLVVGRIYIGYQVEQIAREASKAQARAEAQSQAREIARLRLEEKQNWRGPSRPINECMKPEYTIDDDVLACSEGRLQKTW